MPIVRLACAAALICTATAAAAQWRVPPGKCPPDRRFIEKEMKTRPSDGQVYHIQRNATRTPVDQLIRAFGGPKRARAVANATRAHARRQLAAGARGRMARQLEDLAKRYGSHGVDLSTRLVDGIPYAAIVEHAQEIGADLIVMGTHGRTGIAHFLLGSTAERVVRASRIPVCTVRLPE